MLFLSKGDSKGEYQAIPTEDSPDQPVAGPSGSDSVSPPVYGEDAISRSDEPDQAGPPAFTTYEPTYFVGSQGHIISHDPHLNEDGEALYRFLLSQANIPPKILLHCRGDHTEWRTRQVSRYENGKHRTTTESYSETIVDFDFTIDASSYILPNPNGPLIWLVSDHEATYRGKMVREVDNKPHETETNEAEIPDMENALVQHTLGTIHPTMGMLDRWRHRRRKATVKERKHSAWFRDVRDKWGIPPWNPVAGQESGSQAAVESDELREQLRLSSNPIPRVRYGRDVDEALSRKPFKSLRDWADEYCASNKTLKEFVFEKKLYGWNFEELQISVIQAIQATHYQHQPKVSWNVTGSKITIMPNAQLARMLTHKWLWFFLWITLIYPLFIWPFKRFHPRGGGEWRVTGSAFALSRWAHKVDSIVGESAAEYSERTTGAKPSTTSRPPLLSATASGVVEHQGTREGEWFSEWEDTIMGLVTSRTQSDDPIQHPVGSVRTAGIGLDGYYRG